MAVKQTSELAAELVTTAYNDFFGFAYNSFTTATHLLQDVVSYNVQPISVNVSFDDLTALPADFQAPPAPAAPNIAIAAPSLPTAPLLDEGAIAPLAPAPTFNTAAPVLSLPPRPSALNVTAPDDAPVLGDVALPEAPEILFPDAPVPREIVLAEPPALMNLIFTGTLPSVDGIVLPEVSVAVSETPYASGLLDQIKGVIGSMLKGTLDFFPPEVEQAIYDRARARITVESRRARQDAYEQWSSRGFGEPGGELSARLDQVRQNEQDQAAGINREVMIRVHEIKVSNLLAALSSGVALEGSLMQIAQQIAQRALDAKSLTQRAAVELFNARVSLYNAAIQGFQAEAEVYRARIEAQKAQVDIYRAKIEAAKTISEINQVDAQIYSEAVKVLNTMVDIYEAKVRGYTARIEADRTRVEAYRARVQAYGETVNAKKAEFEAYGEDVRAQVAITGAYQAETAAFGERVRAYGVVADVQNNAQRVQIERNRLAVEQYQSALQAFREQLNAQVAASQQSVALYDGQSRIYSAQIGAESARVESTGRVFTASIERTRAQTQTALENARINSDNATRAAGLQLEGLKTAGTIASQVAAGALSAVNLSAGLSSSASSTAGRDVNVNYSVDGGRTDPPPLEGF